MLPFLKPKKLASIIIAKRAKPDGATTPVKEEGEHAPELMSAAEGIISAINNKDAGALASALGAAMKSGNSGGAADE